MEFITEIVHDYCEITNLVLDNFSCPIKSLDFENFNQFDSSFILPLKSLNRDQIGTFAIVKGPN